MRSFVRYALLSALLLPILASAITPLNISKGWNLLGNSQVTSIDAATQLNIAPISTVWKWNKATSKWAFYTPTMTTLALAAYAQSKNYEVLTRIDAKEGFWVNANAASSLTLAVTAGSTMTLAAGDLTQGWNLMASADNKTPPELDNALRSSLNAASKAINTAWAWDTATSKWRFYAPSLDVLGGTALADYIGLKAYLPFVSAIAATDGFWLNIAAVAPPLNSTNFLYLAGDSISFDDGFLTLPYTLAQFQSKPGISVAWPMYDIAALKFTLVDAGSFNVPAGQTVSVAVSIADTAPGSQGVIKFYIDNVTLAKNGNDITLAVPSAPVAWAFGVLVDGSAVALTNLSSTVANASTTLSVAPNTVSSVVLGKALNNALNSVDSTGNMAGTYKITVVVTNLPLSLASGTSFNSYTIEIPKSLADPSNVRSITGPGIEGYITLAPR